jgi:hypothetical protein
LVAGTAFAASFDVTSNYGVRVTEKGTCERIGATTLTSADTTATSTDIWHDGTVITVELLGQATICANYLYNATYTTGAPGGNYTINAIKGNDYFTITVHTDSDPTTDSIVFGNTNTPICFDLSNTLYNSEDPNNQLVKVSYQSTQGSNNDSYSGDNYVATVKPPAHEAAVCSKTIGTEIQNDTSYLDNWYSGSGYFTKDGLPTLDVCYANNAQNQDPNQCGEVTEQTMGTEVCFTIDDAANVFNGQNYKFAFTTSKTGVGIKYVRLYTGTYSGGDLTGVTQIFSTVTAYYTMTNPGKHDDPVTPNTDPNSEDYLPYSKIKRIEMNVPSVPSGKVYVVVTFNANSCDASAGTLNMGIEFNRNPCGDSFNGSLDVAQIVSCENAASVLLPYLPNFTNSNWWSGMALTNITDKDQTLTIKVIEADGDVYTGSVTIPANNIIAGVFTSAGWSTVNHGVISLSTTSTDSAFGDERFRVEIPLSSYLLQKYYPFGATAIVGTAIFGDGSQAQGYLSTLSVNYNGMY